jgi:tetratricopeptide (TPR) repeat protein
MNKQEEDIKKIKELIEKDELKKALDSLDVLLQDNHSLKEILYQKGRFTNLLRSDRLGVVSYDEANLERNKIRKSVIDLVAACENKQLPKSNQKAIKDFFSRNKSPAFKLLLVVAFLAGSFFIVNNFLEKNVDEGKYLQLGEEKFEAGKWNDAIFYYDALAKSEPKNIYFLERKGYCNFGLKRYQQAINDFNNAIGIGQIEENPQLLFFRGNSFYQLADYDSAINDFNQMLAIQPKHLGATNQRGLAYVGVGKETEACSDFKRVYQYGIQSLKDKAKVNIDNYCK